MTGHSPKSNPSPPPVEERAGPTEVDDDNDSTFDEVSAMSDTTSLASSILKYRVENGRTYHAYKAGSYILPNDDIENDRLDQQHHLALLTLNHSLFNAPVGKDKPLHRVLDAGCGTGIWSMDFADEHPETEVVGVDLSPIQPTFVPPNVSFFVDDLEAEWAYSSPFDFVYLRAMTGSIRDWPKLFRQALDNLSPGGYIELMDPIYPVTSDDGTVPKDSAVYKWSNLMNEAATKMGSALDSGLRYKDQLVEAGFVNVVETPYKWPMNSWPRDKKIKELGAWGNVNLVGGVQGLSLALFTHVLGWNTDELEVFLANVRKDLSNKKLHGYWRVNVVYAQKPE
ncbi:S-adenosyl-L-methionine-dependent methyltransferase [Thelonectria olida]|uniref:S-adenosyl-L-methionine-dependent methyltransferase n=1 Tax=Thelonectria olida TaxID=1576542 RepID=A0A9P8W0C1_9HYPO|nr:S-adenosyl-L-methionine-dependent methyltransferase [Thelonectria olida]